MNSQELLLYKRIRQFSLDDINARLPFSKKLAAQNNWTIEYTHWAIEEYKKFVFLAVVAEHVVIPI